MKVYIVESCREHSFCVEAVCSTRKKAIEKLNKIHNIVMLGSWDYSGCSVVKREEEIDVIVNGYIIKKFYIIEKELDD